MFVEFNFMWIFLLEFFLCLWNKNYYFDIKYFSANITNVKLFTG